VVVKQPNQDVNQIITINVRATVNAAQKYVIQKMVRGLLAFVSLIKIRLDNFFKQILKIFTGQ